jgi:hypothetical protein
MKPGVAVLFPAAATATKSDRCLNRSGGANPDSASGTEPLSATRASRGYNFTAALGRHPRPKAMAALAHQLAWLIGAFHGLSPAADGTSVSGEAAPVFQTRDIR